MLYYARNYPQIGQFSNQELSFLEQIFFTNPTRYGFYGQKITNHLTATISRASLIKIPYSGHFLLRGESLNLYQRLKKDVGEDLLLTSGVRSIVKQMYLFLAKTIVSDGNLSRASRSLAPPGHSYHEIGDFDVGKIGYGQRNFTSAFFRTVSVLSISQPTCSANKSAYLCRGQGVE